MSMILSTMKHEYLNQMNREGSTKESSFEEVVVICKRLFDWWNSKGYQFDTNLVSM